LHLTIGSSQDARSSTSSSSKSYLTFNHTQTNTEVTLIGCLHGSSSSAKDVSDVLRQSPTDVVVLELCPTRYKDLMRDMHRRRECESDNGSNAMRNNGDYFGMVKKTIEARGISTGIAAAVLGGASGISNTLSGFEPGLEFITAMAYVDSCSNSSDGDAQLNAVRVASGGCDVILADRTVDETLRRVGALPSVSLQMLQEYSDSGLNWNKAYGIDADVLANALSGKGNEQLDMGKALFRNKDMMTDLARITLPSFAFVTVANNMLWNMLNVMADTPAFASDDNYASIMMDLSATMSFRDWGLLATDVSMEFISSAFLLFLGYVLVALPTARLILTERDDQLAKGIEDACKVAAGKYSSNESSNNGGRVVAILGFLHVNGVAKKMIQP